MLELIVDSFAGGGGASTGIEMALGRSPDIAINHDATALAMHEANHPDTLHLTADIWEVDPRSAVAGRPVGLAWFSPDCKHFSKAKGGKPVEKKIRGLAWVVVHWANTVRPRVIILENVEEFQTWGPLGPDNKPCPVKKGATFKRWLSELEGLGYVVEHRELRACDYGAPTIRKRLFLIARCDGEAIVWPEPTHGDPKSEAVQQGLLKPWRTAAEIIDWSLPCPSIFDTSEEIMAKYGLRAVRPLQPATMARIAKGVKRYVLDAAKPFIVNLTHHGGERTESIDDPVATVTGAHRGEKALAVPFVAPRYQEKAGHEPRTRSIEDPAATITSRGNAPGMLVTPFAVPRYGERDGQEPRTRSLEEPLPVVVPTGNGASLVAPFISAAQQGGSVRDADDPLHTVTASAKDQNQVVAASLVKNNFGDKPHYSADEPVKTIVAGGNHHALISAHLMTMRNAQKPHQGPDQPTHTVTAGGAHQHLVAAFLAQHNVDGRTGEGNAGRPASEPVSTVMHSGSHQGVVAANLLRQFGTSTGSSVEEPVGTVMPDGMGKTQLSAAFLSKYYGTGEGQVPQDPVHTVTTKDREAVVTVTIDGVTYVITDIGMRMLTPRELFRAQGFPESYIIDRKPDGSPISKTEQVSKCGNSVCPPIAAALVKANYAPREAEPAPEFLEAAE